MIEVQQEQKQSRPETCPVSEQDVRDKAKALGLTELPEGYFSIKQTARLLGEKGKSVYRVHQALNSGDLSGMYPKEQGLRDWFISIESIAHYMSTPHPVGRPPKRAEE